MKTTTAPKGHPKGLYLLFFTEMWERFSYYGMRAIFSLYLLNALMFDKGKASEYYGSYTGLVYLTPLIGGYVADRYWGNRRSILVGGLLMAVGQLLMFFSASNYADIGMATNLMLGGLTFLILGNGFFKPNISTMVGQLYAEGDTRRDAAFTIFYMGINLGSFLGVTVCGLVGESYTPDGAPIMASFKWGFLAACIGMIISVITFELMKNKLLVSPEGQQIGAAPNQSRNDKPATTEGPFHGKPESAEGKSSAASLGIWAGVAAALALGLKFGLGTDWIGAFIYSLTVAAPGYIITDPSLTKSERNRILVIYIIAFFVIFFWAAFEQAGASLTFFAAEQTNRNIFGWEMPASMFNNFNAIFIVILAPVASMLWQALGKKGIEPASPYKQAIGLLFLAVGYIVIAVGVKDLDPTVKVSMFWLTALYMLHTIGELCLSPIGLSMVNKLAPARFTSLLMGVWFLSTSAANKFAGTLSSFYPEGGETKYFAMFPISDLYDFFMLFVVLSGIAGIILFFLSRQLVKMGEGKL